jgi:hypothetical protein
LIKYFTKKYFSKTIFYVENKVNPGKNMEKEMKNEGRNEPVPVITGLVNWWYSMVVMFSVTAMGGVIAFVYFYVQSQGFNSIVYLYVAFPAILLLTLTLWLNGVRKRAPERFLEFIRYLKRDLA